MREKSIHFNNVVRERQNLIKGKGPTHHFDTWGGERRKYSARWQQGGRDVLALRARERQVEMRKRDARDSH